MLRPDPDDHHATLLDLKVVPGAKRDALAGPLGDRLKVRTAQPPEAGKANRAVCELIARATGAHGVELLQGRASPLKTLRLRGISPEQARSALGL
ncbi:MAG: DUF167 domain-containing protein [Planctomycetota bacterium]